MGDVWRLARVGALLALAWCLGVAAGVPALIVTVAATQSRAVTIAAALLVVATVAGVFALRVARMLHHSRSVAAAVACSAVLVTAAVLWWLILRPAPGASPATMANAQVWDLPTGSRIAYEETRAVGTPSATPVILVHGGPGSPARDAASIGSLLANEGFNVFDYHQVGSGLSSRLDAAQYTVARHVADLDAIRVVLGAERVILIGGSWGGQLIAEYIAAHPDRVERAIVASPNAIWAPAFSDNERLTPGGRRDQEDVIGGLPRFRFAHVLMNIVGADPAQALLPDSKMDGVFESAVQDFDMWAGCDRPGSVESETSAGGLGFWANAATTRDSKGVRDPRPRLREVETPVLILRGQCDYIAWEVTREYRDVLPGAVLIPVAASGHVIQQDQPELYRELVRAFVLDEPLRLESYTGTAAP